ncbi:MAG: antibiotic biosynthesis monooxygenase [Flavobacteriaceae bacterium]|nr:antibiotic biosynthesis monooxygenase [Flavobacteriaceae bacterium]
MKPPYYAVIFTNTQTETLEGYSVMAQKMEELAQQQPGYLGMEHARSDIGITISYWETLEAIKNWKANLDHQETQRLGKEQWYKNYTVRICRVEKAYFF